jgi:hypothetical protein
MSPIATYAASFAEGLWLKIISVTDALLQTARQLNT